jgi:hypothetical protein
MRTFYRSSSVLVTEQYFRVRGVPERVVPIRHIDRLYLTSTRTRVSSNTLARRLYQAGTITAVAIVTAIDDMVSRDRGLAVAVPAILMITAVSLLLRPRVDRVAELWAVVGPRRVCLFRSSDQQVIGQLHRAVTRARECHEQ